MDRKKQSVAVLILIFALPAARVSATSVDLPTSLSNLLAAGATVQNAPFEYGKFVYNPVGGYQSDQLVIGGLNNRGLTFISGTSLDVKTLTNKGYLIGFDFKLVEATEAISGFTLTLAGSVSGKNAFAIMTGEVSGQPFFDKLASLGLHDSVSTVTDTFPHPITSGTVSISVTAHGNPAGEVALGLEGFGFELTKNLGAPPPAAPEPASFGFVIAGLAGLCWLRKAKKIVSKHR